MSLPGSINFYQVFILVVIIAGCIAVTIATLILVLRKKGDESGGDEEFVSDGVKVSAQLGPLVGQACNEAVQAVCDPCNGKSDKGPFEVFIDDEDDEEGDQKDSC